MGKTWAGITAGLLAGAAGATAKNAVSYLDQAAAGSPPPTSPSSSAVADTANSAVVVATESSDHARSEALGPLGGIAVGLGVGAVSGLVRSRNATPHPAVAAVASGLAAWAVSGGVAAGTGNGAALAKPANLVRDVASHLAYGVVTGYTLHRILDPHTPTVARLNPFG